MPDFTPKFEARFAGLVLDNVQAVLVRDADNAIALYNPPLTPIASWDIPTPVAVNFPALFLDLDQTALEQSADDSHINQQHTLLLNIAIVGPNPATLKAQLVQYVRALDQVLRTMTKEDLMNGVYTTIGPPAWEVLEHRYGGVRFNQETNYYFREAQLVLAIQITEL